MERPLLQPEKTSDYMTTPRDVGRFKMKNMGDVKPYYYKGNGIGIKTGSGWKESRYCL